MRQQHDPRAEPEPLPAPESEAPSPIDADLLAEVEEALVERHGDRLHDDETVRLEASAGARAAWLRARVGSDERGVEAELFMRGVEGEGLDGALGVLVDYLDGLLEEWLAGGRDAWLPLDWDARAYDDVTLFARGDLRDYAAERAADLLLSGNGASGGHSTSS